MSKQQRIALLLFLLIVAVSTGPVMDLNARIAFGADEGTEATRETVLLVFDYRNYFADLRDSVTTIREMLGHFNVEVVELDQSVYRQGQMDRYDYLVVMGMQGAFTNDEFISDVGKRTDKILWIGKGIERLLDQTDRYDIVYSGPVYDASTVIYAGKSYPIGVKREFSVVSLESTNVSVQSWLQAGNAKMPFILSQKNLRYVSRIDLNEPLIFIFADTLFGYFPPLVEPGRTVYIRIEDVHPFRDPQKLRDIADFLYSRNVPFLVGLIPAHRLPDSKYITEMDENPEFIEAVQYMQEKGGSIVLHGYTHTVFGSDITGEGYEYWNGEEDKPIDQNIEEWVRYTIGKGVRLSVENDIYPLGFEAPHYAMSQDAYKSLKHYFSTYSGQIQSSDWGFSTSIIPFEIRDTVLFNKFLPESLGYIDPNDSEALEKIMNKYDQIQIVRNNMAGVFYHPYLDIEYLKQIIDFLDDRGVVYYDMRQDSHWVKFDGYEIETKNGEILVTYPENRGNTRKKLRKIFSLTTIIVIAVLSAVIYTFVKIFIQSRDMTNRKMRR